MRVQLGARWTIQAAQWSDLTIRALSTGARTSERLPPYGMHPHPPGLGGEREGALGGGIIYATKTTTYNLAPEHAIWGLDILKSSEQN